MRNNSFCVHRNFPPTPARENLEQPANMKPTAMFRIILLSVLIITTNLLQAQHSVSGYIISGNDSIFYETVGSGDVIILIHDGLIHREVWDNQFSDFAKDHKVIRYDRRGYGKSSPAEGIYSHLDDLDSLFSQLKIGKACLIACSSGGALAIDFTLKYPEKVSSLVLVGAVVGGFSYTRHFITRGGHLPSSFNDDQEESLYYASDDPYLIYSKNTAARERAIELVKNNPQRVYNRPRYIRQPIPAYQRLNEIKVPVLIMAGEFDIPDVHAHAGAINAGIPDSRRIIIPDAGHLVPLEQPALFNEAVTEFLNSL
jgi:3-oxoadipate enol-lactonase